MIESTRLAGGGTLIYEPAFFPANEAASLFDTLRREAPWKQEVGRGRPFPRLTAWYADEGLAYRYSGVVHPPRALTPRLDEIRATVEAASAVAFNSVLANLYRDGRDSVGWHRDSDYEHGGQPMIASVSFGAVRRFQIRADRGRSRAAVDLESGSLLLMEGEAVDRWWHCVPKTARSVGLRINLTFRHMGERGITRESDSARSRPLPA